MSDLETGYSKLVRITIKDDVRLKVSPPVVYLPVNATGEATITGGSGVYTFDAADGLEWNGDQFTAKQAGEYAVLINDRFADRQSGH